MLCFEWRSLVGVVSTNHQLSGKLSELRLSFSLWNYVTYRRIFWQSMDVLYFLCWNAVFWKNHQGYSSWFFEKWGSEVGNEIEPILVRTNVYMSWNYTVNLTVIACIFLHKNVLSAIDIIYLRLLSSSRRVRRFPGLGIFSGIQSRGVIREPHIRHQGHHRLPPFSNIWHNVHFHHHHEGHHRKRSRGNSRHLLL